MNVLGSVYTTQALLPAMITKRQGKIVFISSILGQVNPMQACLLFVSPLLLLQVGVYENTAYCSSKFALRGLAESLQMEVAPHNIGVSISFPSGTDTPLLHAEMDNASDVMKELLSLVPIFQPASVACDVWNGVESGKFQITHGLGGFLMGVVSAGMSPVTHVWDMVIQVRSVCHGNSVYKLCFTHYRLH